MKFSHLFEGKDLSGSPEKVDGDFDCSVNRITSLEGAPSSVGGDFWCNHNRLTSLEGAPSSVGGDFWCYGNRLTSLRGIHLHVKKIKGAFDVSDNPIESHVLGLLLVDGVTHIKIDNKKVEEILNRHVGEGKQGMIKAQRELIDAGLDEYAEV